MMTKTTKSLQQLETEAVEFIHQHGFTISELTDPLSVRMRDGLVKRLSRIADEYVLRHEFIRKFGFSILSRATIGCIAQYAPLVEVGSGSGYWAYELQRRRIDVVATDPGSGQYGFWEHRQYKQYWDTTWTTVEKLKGPQAVKKYPERTLLTVWPDMSSWPVKTLRAYRGEVVIYVGEGYGGCTADDAFHKYLDTHFELIEEQLLPVFFGIHDHLQVWKRT